MIGIVIYEFVTLLENPHSRPTVKMMEYLVRQLPCKSKTLPRFDFQRSFQITLPGKVDKNAELSLVFGITCAENGDFVSKARFPKDPNGLLAKFPDGKMA